MSVDHYENFPVASLLCPQRLRPAVAAIYWFARTADDLADEGDIAAAQRLSDLSDYRRDLEAVGAGQPPSSRWPHVFVPLREAVCAFALPLQLLRQLLSAFEQDVVKQRYTDRIELLDYCERSANPVGRLLLHLYGVNDERSLAQSDSICTALQLANFWQDLGVDAGRGRLYAPVADCARHGLEPDAVLAKRDSAAVRALVADLVDWTRSLMDSGAPLVHTLSGRSGWELRLVVQGGLGILDKIERMRFGTLLSRPTLGWTDAPALVWRALWMRCSADSLVSKAT